jgi:hypothetical protein
MKMAERFWYPLICATFHQLQKSEPNSNVQVNNGGSITVWEKLLITVLTKTE